VTYLHLLRTPALGWDWSTTAGIETGVLKPWKQVYSHFFNEPERWQLQLFSKLKMRNGGDYKTRKTS